MGFDDVFSLRKPRDFRAGLASGAKSVAKGVLAGESSPLVAGGWSLGGRELPRHLCRCRRRRHCSGRPPAGPAAVCPSVLQARSA